MSSTPKTAVFIVMKPQGDTEYPFMIVATKPLQLVDTIALIQPDAYTVLIEIKGPGHGTFVWLVSKDENGFIVTANLCDDTEGKVRLRTVLEGSPAPMNPEKRVVQMCAMVSSTRMMQIGVPRATLLTRHRATLKGALPVTIEEVNDFYRNLTYNLMRA
jgi:hypothetical protein